MAADEVTCTKCGKVNDKPESSDDFCSYCRASIAYDVATERSPDRPVTAARRWPAYVDRLVVAIFWAVFVAWTWWIDAQDDPGLFVLYLIVCGIALTAYYKGKNDDGRERARRDDRFDDGQEI